MEEKEEHPIKDILSNREREVTELMIVQERTSKEIASEIFVSTDTVSTHKQNIYKKLGKKTIGEVTIKLYKEGLLDVNHLRIDWEIDSLSTNKELLLLLLDNPRYTIKNIAQTLNKEDHIIESQMRYLFKKYAPSDSIRKIFLLKFALANQDILQPKETSSSRPIVSVV